MGSDVKILASASANRLVAMAAARLSGVSMAGFNAQAPAAAPLSPTQSLDA